MSSETSGDAPLEMWAGLECTINRVGDLYIDQSAQNGHYNRPGDIDLLADLGITTLRYPVLWERHQPQSDSIIYWSFAAQNLARIRARGVKPVIGLVHHGSGPSWVNFFDGSFENGLAEYAARVAEQFPWAEYYTPVNEPLTTARFCGLYGLWYPHGTSDDQFARILVAECRATVMAMAAIRKINPAAKLVQTDDLGKIYSSPALHYQAEFENERRWLSWDLIGGKVRPGHRMWAYLLWAGIDEAELYYFLEHPTPADIIGINHYVTSARFLDDELERYPAHLHGGNGIHEYVDVEAVRTLPLTGTTGIKELFREAWERYKTPLAITEAHIHCSREQQGRWLLQLWRTAKDLKANGVHILGLTAWAAFGSQGWSNLLTHPGGEYESGLFDTRSGVARPTALAKLVKSLSAGQTDYHAGFNGKGWWEKPGRLLFGFTEEQHVADQTTGGAGQRILILGRTGTLGKAFGQYFDEHSIPHSSWGREALDLREDIGTITSRLQELSPYMVINATGYVRVDDAESEPAICMETNHSGAAKLAAACNSLGIKLLSFSSDLVFDGTKGGPYHEGDSPSPVNTYGKSKALAEADILSACPNALLIRTSAFFGPGDEYNFLTVALREIRAGRSFMAAEDLVVSPTYIPDLVQECLNLLLDDACGIWHLANTGAVTWAAFAKMAAAAAGLDDRLIIPAPSHDMHWKAARPRSVPLTSLYGNRMPTLENALQRYIAATRQHLPEAAHMAVAG